MLCSHSFLSFSQPLMNYKKNSSYAEINCDFFLSFHTLPPSSPLALLSLTLEIQYMRQHQLLIKVGARAEEHATIEQLGQREKIEKMKAKNTMESK